MIREMLTNRKFLAVVIAVKIGVLGTLALVMTDAIQIGEKMLFAEDTKAVKPDAAAVEEVKAKDATVADKGRKSFLDGLLELPKLDKDSPKKEEIARYLSLAERKRAQIDERMALLKEREKQLQEVEKSIGEKLARLDDERRFFAQTIQQEKEFKDKRQLQIIEMYKKMEPKKAAPLFEAMDKDLVVYLLNAMPNKQVTKILETMNPQKSVELTEYFGRVRSAREYDTLREMNKSLSKEFDVCRGMPSESVVADAKDPAKTIAADVGKTPDAKKSQTAQPGQPAPPADLAKDGTQAH